MSLFLVAAFAAGVIYFGFGLAGSVARPAVAGSSLGDAAAAARSGGVRWGPSHGPEGGPALALAVAPSAPEIVYVGTGRGVFRSMNGGRSWASAGLAQPPGPDGSSPPGVSSLAVDPRTPTTVYAGLNGRWEGGTTYRHAVFKSTNGGRTWRALVLRGQVVAITPTGPPTVYAAAGGSGGTRRLFRSTDGGRSWQPADRGLPSTYLSALAFDPTSPATVYAAMGPRGVFEGSNSGARWHTLGVPAAYREVTAIAVDPRHPQTVYAGTDTGVIKSLDGGDNWRLVNAAMGGHGRDRWYGQISGLVVDARDSRTVYATTRCAGVVKSTDGGRRWSPANTGLEPRCPWAYALALDPRAPRRIYAADSARGMFKSLDGGARWHGTNDGLSLSTVFSLAVDPQRPETVYAGTSGLGLFKSSNGGAHWRALPSSPRLVAGIALDPSNTRNILIVAAGYGIVRSTDAGRTWTGTSLGARTRLVNVVAISGNSAYAGVSGRGLFGSSDGGRSWRELGALAALGARHVEALAIASGPAAAVYAGITGFGASKAGGLYKSTDGGNS
jgi:photosystem II stability/assembly factor-like uncharacterized protein